MVFLQVHAAGRQQPKSGVPQGTLLCRKPPRLDSVITSSLRICDCLKSHTAVGFAEGTDEANQHKVSVASGSPPEASANPA